MNAIAATMRRGYKGMHQAGSRATAYHMLVQARYSGVDEELRGVQAGASPKLQGALKPMRPEGAGSIIWGTAGANKPRRNGAKAFESTRNQVASRPAA